MGYMSMVIYETREAINARIIELLEQLNIIPRSDLPESQEAVSPSCQIENKQD